MSTETATVPETVKESTSPAPNPTLKDADKSFAYKCVQKAYESYWGKDGVAELEAKLERKIDGSYRHQLYLIARRAVEIGGNNLKAAREVFIALTDYAEQQLKNARTDKETGKTPAIGELLPSWPNYKSGILVGFDQNISPLAVDTVSKEEMFPNSAKFIEAARASKRKAEETAAGTNAGGAVVKVEFSSDKLIPELKGAMVALSQTVHEIPRELQLAATAMIIGVNNGIATLVTDFQRRMNATGNDLSKSQEIADALVGKPVAVATTGDPAQDAVAAERVRKENEEHPAPRRRGHGPKVA